MLNNCSQLCRHCSPSYTNFILHLAFILYPEGKVKFYSYSILICYFYWCTSTKIKLELKKIILNFGYGISYKYEGMLAHSFDRFNVVTKFIWPSIGDLNFSKLDYDNSCAYLDNKNVCSTDSKKYMLDLMTFCKKD